MLIDFLPGVAIRISYGNQKAFDTNGVQWRVRHATYSGGYCAAKSPHDIELLPLAVPKTPLRQSVGGVLMTSDHAPFLIGLDAAIMVNIA